MAGVEEGEGLVINNGQQVRQVEVGELWEPVDPEAIERQAIEERYAELDGADVSDPLPVAAEDVEAWTKRRFKRIREAGLRATWAGRRDLRGRTFADRESVGPDGERIFKGRYPGKCRLPRGIFPIVIEKEYGGLGSEAIAPVDQQG